MLVAVTANSTPGQGGGAVGLFVRRGDSTGTASLMASNMSALHPGKRMRPSHNATTFRGRASWAGHYRNWGDDRRVPIPMRRGVPFRGDSLGSGNFAASPNSA